MQQDQQKQAIKYESVIPKGKFDDKFNKEIKDEEGNVVGYDIIADLKLIKTLDELREFTNKCKDKIIAVDTETTGLSYLRDVIVGFSVSLDSYSGIYVPIRHQHKKVTKVKKDKLDENGNVMLTKAGKPRQVTVSEFSYSEYEGNLDPKKALDMLDEMMLNARGCLLHNSEYDLNMIKKEGYDVMKYKTFDTMLLPYIYDPEARLNGLKPLTKWLLGRHVQDFSEVTGGEKEFQYTNPEESYTYAAADSCNTFGVYEKLYPRVIALLNEAPKVLKFNGKRYNVLQEDNKLVRAFVDYYGHVKLNVDRQAAIAYKELIEKETKETIEKIYTYFGIGPFSLSTGSKEFQEVMKKFHMETGAMTKTGKRTSYGKDGIKEMNKQQRILRDEIWPKLGKIFFVDSKIKAEGPASMEAYNLINFLKIYGKPYFKFLNLDKSVNVLNVRDLNNKPIDKMTFVSMLKEMYASEKKKLEILQAVLKYSSLMKALNSYVTKLTEVDECIMRYRLTGTKSCRLSSGNGSKNSKDKNDYYIDLNAQNLTKPSPKFYVAKKGNGEGNILGWEFTPVDDEYAHSHKEDEYIVEGTSKTANIRACIVAPEDRYVVSMDFSSQEVYIQALLSQDQLLLDILKSGDDIHKRTAIAIWGEEHYDKFKRRKAKACTFLSQYCGGPRTLAEQLEIPFEEAKDILDKYNSAYFGIIQWRNKITEEMYKNNGKIWTVFGRPRQLYPWLKISRDTGDDGIAKYAERSCPSHFIQGMAGDILRRVMNILYQEFFKDRDPNIDFMQTVHDEVNYSINKDPKILLPYIKKLQSIMDFPYIMPDLPIKTTVEIGTSLGTCFPFVWTDENKTELIPKREH